MATYLHLTHLQHLSPITPQNSNSPLVSPIPRHSISFLHSRWIKTTHSLSTRSTTRSSLVSADVVTEQTNKPTLRELCQGHVPEHVLRRGEEVGFVLPTDVQEQALPILFSGRDCILHSQVTILSEILVL
uniref:DEAD-box RNA helicase Q domain-containing protein n=1 Tax=Daucus carota subsp. sativus TaxID=79200 RepID=A0A175YP67_DAUCS